VVARRVVFYPAVGDKITQGQKIGLIKFSSRVEHYIPDNFNICVNINEKTKGGITILAKRIN
ncbi:MAG: phosphatidylserine decarboxylase, partial [Deferribacterota bacterium]|nr:phosphatidylserine decarboxylase [Deferribacterota bacterium]